MERILSVINSASVAGALEVLVASATNPVELNLLGTAVPDWRMAHTGVVGADDATLYRLDASTATANPPYVVASLTAGLQWIAIAGHYHNPDIATAATLTVGGSVTGTMSYADPAGNTNPVIVTPTVTITANNANSAFNRFNMIAAGTNFNFTGSTGIRGLQGHGQSSVLGTGVVTAIIGVAGSVNNGGTGTVTSGYALYAFNNSNTGGGTFQNAYGLFIESITNGSVSNFAIKAGSGLVSLGDTTASTTSTTGAVQSAGGIGAVGRIYTGTGLGVHTAAAASLNVLDINVAGTARSFLYAYYDGTNTNYRQYCGHGGGGVPYWEIYNIANTLSFVKVFNNTGNVVLGNSATPTDDGVNKLQVTGSVTVSAKLTALQLAANGALTTGLNSIKASPTFTATGSQIANELEINGTPAGAMGAFDQYTAVRAYAACTGTIAVPYMCAVQPRVNIGTSGNTTWSYGVAVFQANVSTGTVADMAHLYVQTPTNSGGGAITRQYGLYFEAMTGAGTNYSIFSAGAGLVKIQDTTSATTPLLGAVVIGNGTASTSVGIGAGRIFAGLQATVGDNASSGSSFIANGANLSTRDFRVQTAGVLRWFFGGEGTSETGGDAGTNFFISARTDAGAAIDQPINIIRAAGGAITITRPLNSSNTTVSTSGTTGALTLTGGLAITSAGGTTSASSPRSFDIETNTGGAATAYTRVYGGFLQASLGSTDTVSDTLTGLCGIEARARTNGTSTAAIMQAVRANTYVTGSGAIPAAYGVYASVNPFGTGTSTVSTAYGVYSDLQLTNTTSLTVPTAVGVGISVTGGVVTSAIGLSIASVTTGSSSNAAISTGLGKIVFGDTTSAASSISAAMTVGNGVAATSVGIGGGKIITGSTVTVGSLTSGRLTFAGAAGLLSDDTKLTWASPKLAVGDGSAADFALGINGAAGQERKVEFYTAASIRWRLLATSDAESGGNAGSKFQLQAYSDAAGFIDNPITILRVAGGLISISRPTNLGDTTDATTATTGSAIVSGGAGIAKTLVVGQSIATGVTSTATAAATTTLTLASKRTQIFTGATTQTIQFPAANAAGAGIAIEYTIINRSSGTVTPTRAGADTFVGGGTTDPVLTLAQQKYTSDGVSVWYKI